MYNISNSRTHFNGHFGEVIITHILPYILCVYPTLENFSGIFLVSFTATHFLFL